ncbi:hypothetical protein LTR95_013649 [Oleoguttula sp. CCFEE 5521]
MATVRSSIPHEDRTAHEPRGNRIEPVILTSIEEVNPTIRLLRLTPSSPTHTIKFQPGQWVDTLIPGLPRAGGFTLTSPPSTAHPQGSTPGYLELAIQKSRNPPAAWLWRPASEILLSQLAVRVGGSFVYPPVLPRGSKVERLVLIAGGVGINPLMSMLSHVMELPREERPRRVAVVYSTKPAEPLERTLFLPRLQHLLKQAEKDGGLTFDLFLTSGAKIEGFEGGVLLERTFRRRVSRDDLLNALDGDEKRAAGARKGTVVYVCGTPAMTDDIVEFLTRQEGMSKERVLCEKWW